MLKPIFDAFLYCASISGALICIDLAGIIPGISGINFHKSKTLNKNVLDPQAKELLNKKLHLDPIKN